jgi:X-Pro dipeptidyl-peptidase
VPGIDTDRDGYHDRIRLQVRRPAVTESGVRLPIVMIASPYSGGTLPYHTYDIFGELYVPTDLDAKGKDLRPKPTWPMEPPPVDPSLTYYDGTQGTIANISTSGYQNYFLPRGFIFVYAQNLGTGKSTGCPTIGGVEENLSMKAVIDWFNGEGRAWDQAGNAVTAYWTTGNTAMIGVSYDGTLPLNAAVTGVAGLKAIVPIAGVSSYYDHRRSGGAVSVIGDSDSLMVNVLTRMYPERCHYLRDQHHIGTDRVTGDFNLFWHERNLVKDVDKIRAAVLISHGLNDPNVKMRHAYRLWQALNANGVPAKIWLNTGGHGDGANSGARQAAWRDELNRFWSQYLFGVDNQWTSGPRAAVQRSGSTWADYETWPVPTAALTTLNLTASADNAIGHLGIEAPKGWLPVAFERVIDDSITNATVHVAAAQSPHRLVYKSHPLAGPVHVSGLPTVKLRMAFSKPAAVVSAMLVQYNANGTQTIISRGWTDPQNRASIWETQAITPGEFYDIEFELQPHDHVFPAGSRIGLVLLGGDWEGNPPLVFTMRPPPGTELTVDTARSTVTLPIVGGRDAFAQQVLGQASIAIDPAHLLVKMKDSVAVTAGIRIHNTAATDATDLAWTVREAETDCSTPTDVSWLGTQPNGPPVSPAGWFSKLHVTFDAANRPPGDYQALLCFSSNGGSAVLPVTMIVEP